MNRSAGASNASAIYTSPLAEVTFDVQWGDMDALGHVNNARYLTYFENVRMAWFDTLGADIVHDPATGPILATASCTFVRPLVYPAAVRVTIAAGKPGRSSFTTFYEMTDVRDGARIHARGDAVVVWIDKRSGKSTGLPETLRTALHEHALHV